METMIGMISTWLVWDLEMRLGNEGYVVDLGTGKEKIGKNEEFSYSNIRQDSKDSKFCFGMMNSCLHVSLRRKSNDALDSPNIHEYRSHSVRGKIV